MVTMHERSVWAELVDGHRSRRDGRMRILHLVPKAGWSLVSSAVLVQIAAGILPVAFILATSAVVAECRTR